MKDYKDPFTLGKYIKKKARPLNQGDLAWDEWFYVYPMYRELQRPNYQECARRAAEGLPSNVFILNEKQFKEQVLTR